MLGAGTVINPIIKIVTTVAILAAVYFFIIKPTLDTTEEISSGINESVSRSLEGTNEQVRRALEQAERAAEQSSPQQFNFSATGLPPGQAQRLLDCIQRANADVSRMQACTERFAE